MIKKAGGFVLFIFLSFWVTSEFLFCTHQEDLWRALKSKTKAQTFKFQKKESKLELRKNLNLMLSSKRAFVPRADFFRFRAKQLTRDNFSKLSEILGRKIDLGKPGTGTRLNKDDLLGMFYSANMIYKYLQSKSKYQEIFNKERLPQRRTQLTSKWNQLESTVISQFRIFGIRRFNRNTLNEWANELSNSPLYGQLEQIDRTRKFAGQSQRLSTDKDIAIISIDRVLVEGAYEIPSIGERWRNACAEPFVSDVISDSYHLTYDYTTTITYPCGIDWDWLDSSIIWCDETVTLFTFEFDIGYDIGYEITCCGGSAWVTGQAELCAGILDATVCLECNAGGSAVIGAGVAIDNTTCDYGLGIVVSINCSILGAGFGYSIPYGYVVTGPCPPGNPCGF